MVIVLVLFNMFPPTIWIAPTSEIALAKAKNDAALYKALVDCKEYRDLASSDIAGVSEAIESYDSALASYNAKADAINGDIAEVNTVVTVTRTNSIASVVMSVINKIFNR